MAGTANEESATERLYEGIASGQQRSMSSEALAEWRSSELLENGSTSISPYWDSDDEDYDGPKPSDLFWKETWKIEKFSVNNKQEIKSNPFEVGGYKWYILIYPQGCDVTNHLSLFLCVANHDNLLPGWSHFAQFTIAIVNKDPKKSKYSDTLHRFWKKEHDWGWKKFIELSKISDGFIDSDTLIIKAQVQVIRERSDRPFRCLDCLYRRELVRVYLTNVEQICRRFVDERRGKLGKVMGDKARWSSFCAFWLEIDQNAQRRMSREKADPILKVVVKHFFLEKEVTSTLIMDSLYSGLRALEYQIESKKDKKKYIASEELSVPIVRLEKDTFILMDDALLLLERAVLGPFLPKDEKSPQNRTKDDGFGEDFTKDSIERDERRLTELGRKTIEIFVLAHIVSSKIEVAYQEAISLKRQEELIREEEAAWIAETEQKTKRGQGKKSKKKQGKQKRNNNKGRDNERDEKPALSVEPIEEPIQVEEVSDVSDLINCVPEVLLPDSEHKVSIPIKLNTNMLEVRAPEDNSSGISDVSAVQNREISYSSINCVPEVLLPDSEDTDSSPIKWNTNMSEVRAPEDNSSGISDVSAVQNGERSYLSILDDSSSTCSTDSLQSIVTNANYKGNSLPNNKTQKQKLRSRGRHQQAKVTHEATGGVIRTIDYQSNVHAVHKGGASFGCKVVQSEEAVVRSSQDLAMRPEQHVAKEKDISLQRETTVSEEADEEKPASIETIGFPSSSRSPANTMSSVIQLKSGLKSDAANGTILVRKQSSENPQRTNTTIMSVESAEAVVTPKPYAHKISRKSTEEPTAQQVPASAGNPRVQQLSTNERPMAQQVPASAGNPRVPQLSTTERPIAQQQVSVVTETSSIQQVMSKPLSAPLVLGSVPLTRVVSTVQTSPVLSRSVSAAGRLGPDPSSATSSYAAQLYRNAMMGNHVTSSSAGYTQPQSPNSAINSSQSYVQSCSLMSAPIDFPQSSERMDLNSVRSNLSFGMVSHDVLQNGPQWMDNPQRGSSRSINCDPSLLNDMQNTAQWMDNSYWNGSRINHDSNLCNVQTRLQDHVNILSPAGISGPPNTLYLPDEFPHIDIINDLLKDDHLIGNTTTSGSAFQSFSNGHPHLNRQFTFPGDVGMSMDTGSQTSSYRFERIRSYPDGEFHHNYNPAGGHQFDSNLIPQANFRPYSNGQTDGSMLNQWQMAGSDLSQIGMRSYENDVFAYHIPEYANLTGVANGYPVFRPSGGL